MKHPRLRDRATVPRKDRAAGFGIVHSIVKRPHLGAKLPSRVPMNERQVTAAVGLLPDCQDCPTSKSPFRETKPAKLDTLEPSLIQVLIAKPMLSDASSSVASSKWA